MTYDQLLNRVIADGIAEVREAYADSKEHHKRDGAIEGFEACRGKTPSELVVLWTKAEQSARQSPFGVGASSNGATDYWRERYKSLQVEFVLNVVSVGLATPLLSHLPTTRGVRKYAEIVGVRGARGVGAES